MMLAKYECQDGEGSVNFKSLDDLVSSPLFESFIYIDISNSNLTEAPSTWPYKLQILKCEKNRLKKIENLPSTLRMLYARVNKIEDFPIVSQCTLLELIDLYDNNIVNLHTKIPMSVRAIDISFNKLRDIAYYLVPDHVRITASFCFLTQRPPSPFDGSMIYDHNDIVYNRPNRFIVNDVHSLPNVKVTVYSDAQNVHASSVQSSTNTSLDIILKYEYKNQKTLLPHLVLKEIHSAYIKYTYKKKNILYCIIPKCFLQTLPLEQWCQEQTIHSVHGISYKTLLRQVWAIIQDHTARNELEMILCEELDASRHVCFTGRFTRTLNALSGFVEGVQIGISPREQMQNQIAKAIEKCREDYGPKYVDHAKELVGKILNEFEVLPVERDVWLDAIE